jgi:hypothetical protein
MSYSQCNGNIYLTTQSQVNFFNCTTVNGDLIISSTNGSITDLNPIFNAGLTNVTGTLVIQSSGGSLSLTGLDGITSCGQLFLDGNGIISLGDFTWQLATCNQIYIQGTSIQTVNLFPFLSTSKMAFFSNPELTEITNVGNVMNLNNLHLVNNEQLVDVNITNLTSVSDSLIIFGNQLLSACCFAEPLIPTADFISIANNDMGCNSVAEVSQLPVISCIDDITVNTSPMLCAANFNFTDPGVIENCELTAYTANIIDANGVTIYNGPGSPGMTFGYTLPVGENTFAYSATDGAGNGYVCLTIVQVVDASAPTWTTTSPATFTGICGINDPSLIFSSNFPLALDNCGIATYNDVFTDAPGCGGSFTRTFTSTAIDVHGNLSAPFITIISMVDQTAPVLTGVPADITISCGDPDPLSPILAAFDQCQGDVSSNITAISSVTLGNCTTGTPAQLTTFTYTATDGCNNSSSATWTITRVNNFTFDLGADVNVCNQANYTINPGPIGDTYLWSTGQTTQSIVVSSSGNYTVTISQTDGCCYADAINVQFGTTPNASATGNQLGCSGNPVIIMGNSSTPPVTYSWSGPSGFTSNVQNPSVNVAGSYTLTVTNNQGCTATATAQVTVNNQAPNVTTTGATITCTNTTVMITATSTTSGVTYAWSGPGGFTSNLANPTVNAAGMYNVVVTAPNNCIANGSAVVLLNNISATSTLNTGVITCANTTTTINHTVSANATTYAWTGPNNFSSTVQSPTVSTGGAYSVTITANNGCTSTNQITVAQDITIPTVMAQGGAIPCGSSSINLQGSSTTSGVSYAWSGPSGFTSGLQNPQVNVIGSYTLVVTASNGCTAQATATVVSDANAPVVMTTGGSLTCLVSMITLSATSSIPNSTFLWSGPNGFTSTIPNPTVSVSGNYIVEVTSPNNCKTTSSSTVINDTAVPSVAITLGTVDCAAGSRIINATSSITNPSFTWTGPNGFTSTSASPSITKAGSYIATTVGANGCVGSSNIMIAHDIKITHQITTTNATDTSGGTASIVINSGTPNFNIVWDNGIAGMSTTNLSPGNHNVIVVDGLGCTKIIPFEIVKTVATSDEDIEVKCVAFPNPFSEILTVDVQLLQPESITITLTDGVGRVLRKMESKSNSNRHELTIKDLDYTGILLLNIQGKSIGKTIKVIKI